MIHLYQRLILDRMKKGTCKQVLFFFLFCLIGFQSRLMQAQSPVTLVIGAASGNATYLMGPVYQDTTLVTANYSRYAYIYTPAELGIPSNSKIVKMEWLKKDSTKINPNNKFIRTVAITAFAQSTKI